MVWKVIKDGVEVKTNNHWRNFVQGYELTSHERKAFLEYMNEEDIACKWFLRFKGNTYCTDDFMRAYNLPGWDGYLADSYSSGLVVKFDESREQYKIGVYVS